jgi:hypothetical protein
VNANELADALQETEPYYSTDYKLFDQAATMLRQQQAEIEALKTYKPNQTLECSFDLAGFKLPAKTLTDEEIRHIQAQCHLKDVGYDTFIMRFARAILRKAQEK